MSNARPPISGPAAPDQTSPEATALEAATRRLSAARDGLEAATERRRDADRGVDELASRIHALGADRSRLADELDGALVRTRALERANRDIAQRLDGAIETIRTVIEGDASS
jgi:hypothetical protein